MIQPALLTAVQPHPLGAVTVTLPVPPLAVKFLLVGEIEEVHGTSFWVTVKVCPAMKIAPVRGLASRLDATEYVTVPLPVPLLPDVIVIQLAWLAANQLQSPDVVTATLPSPPVPGKN